MISADKTDWKAISEEVGRNPKVRPGFWGDSPFTS